MKSSWELIGKINDYILNECHLTGLSKAEFSSSMDMKESDRAY